MIKPRKHQIEAMEAIITSFKTGERYHLAACPTGYGKTILASMLMQYALDTYGVKCVFLAHLTELIQQNYDKFKMVAPEMMDKTSIFASSLAQKEVCDITIASRQTMARNLNMFTEKVGLLIIDEAHLIGDDGEYDKIIDYLAEINPRLRVLGITGTPFRLNTGYIYGDNKRFNEPCYQIGMRELTEMGYLAPFRYKIVATQKLKSDLKGVKMTAGEYNQAHLGLVLSDKIHMGSVKLAIEDHAEERKSIIVFATSISHSKLLATYLGGKCVHSKMKKDEKRQVIDDFKSGKIRILVNPYMLAIGFDAPNVDCVVLARPTKSPAVYLQQIGRSCRLSEGKTDALILDVVNNYAEHGHPYDPIVKEKNSKKKPPEFNICPECFELAEPDVEVCKICGALMKEQIERREKKKAMEQNRLDMIDIENIEYRVIRKWAKPNHKTKKGFTGTMYCIKVTGRSKPLFRFESNQAKNKSVKKIFDEVVVGEEYRIQADRFGEWITKTQMNTKSK